MNISLTKELESLVQEKLATGLYHSASEVVREALRLLQEKDQLRQIKLQRLREDIAMGDAALERGDFKPLDLEQFKTRARARRKASR